MDSVQAQLQIRQNALEAQEYAQDLLSWQQTIKAKSSSNSKQHAQQHPQLPVRGRASGTAPAASNGLQQPQVSDSATAEKQAHPAAHTYKNYSKWDTFDVDAALNDTEGPATGSKAASVQPPPAPVRSSKEQQPESLVQEIKPNAPVASSAAQTPASKAAALKDQGNKLFQAKYFDDAISCYTQSIATHPTAVAYANRAMAYLKLGKYSEAEADCTAALQLDPTYAKAWHRRATAHKQLGKLLEAAADFEEVLRLEPSNASAQSDRTQALDQHLKQQQIQHSNVWHSLPVKTQPPADAQVQPASLSPHMHTEPKQQDQQPSATQQQPQQPQQPQQAADTTAVAAAATSVTTAAAAAADTASMVARPVTPNNATSSKSSSTQVSPQQRQSVAAAAQAAAQQLAARLASSLKPPKTGHDFESAWRSLKGDVQLQVRQRRCACPACFVKGQPAC
jgi:tetratricopeptide (TPR) repeat protein